MSPRCHRVALSPRGLRSQPSWLLAAGFWNCTLPAARWAGGLRPEQRPALPGSSLGERRKARSLGAAGDGSGERSRHLYPPP